MIRAALIAVAALLGAATASAQPRLCGNADAMMKRLADKYGEQKVAGGLMGNPTEMGDVQIFIITANVKSGTWTAIVLLPNGVACALASGSDWAATAPGELPKPGEDL